MSSVNKHKSGIFGTFLIASVFLSNVRISIGDFTVGAHLTIIFVLGFLARPQRDLRYKRVIEGGFGLSLLITFHALFSLFFTPCVDSAQKMVVSTLVFVTILMTVCRLACVKIEKSKILDLRILSACILVPLLYQLLSSFDFASNAPIRASGFFLEPSHLALSTAPILSALISSRTINHKIWGLFCFIVTAILSPSVTLFAMVGVSYIAIESYRSPQGWRLGQVLRYSLFLGTLVAGLILSNYGDDFEQRLLGVLRDDVQLNLSSLVYRNGWESAIMDLKRSSGMGLGFNRMGCDPLPETATAEILEQLEVREQNFNDGSFVLAKMISEFGVFGLLTWAYCCAWLLGVINAKVGRGFDCVDSEVEALILGGAAVTVFGAPLRGINYFSGSFIYGLFCVIYIYKNSSKA